MRKRFAFSGSDVRTPIAMSSSSRARAPDWAAAWIVPSAAAAASRHDAGCIRSPSTGVAPRACTLAAASLFRTSASTWRPPRTSDSSTAEPT